VPRGDGVDVAEGRLRLSSVPPASSRPERPASSDHLCHVESRPRALDVLVVLKNPHRPSDVDLRVGLHTLARSTEQFQDDTFGAESSRAPGLQHALPGRTIGPAVAMRAQVRARAVSSKNCAIQELADHGIAYARPYAGWHLRACSTTPREGYQPFALYKVTPGLECGRGISAFTNETDAARTRTPQRPLCPNYGRGVSTSFFHSAPFSALADVTNSGTYMPDVGIATS